MASMTLHLCTACGYPKRDSSGLSELYCSRCGAFMSDVDIAAAPHEALVKSVEFLWRTLIALQERVESIAEDIRS
jgi:uncharacterized Zn finger protein (UPF0148 family)